MNIIGFFSLFAHWSGRVDRNIMINKVFTLLVMIDTKIYINKIVRLI